MSGYILGRTISTSRLVGFARRAQPESGEVITYSGDGHLITFAPTGAGKSSGPVITNGLKHPGQLIVLDMKGEIYAATADARRKMGQEVYALDLRDTGYKYGSLNPIDMALRSGTEKTAIARSFAAEMVERTGGERDRFWTDASETMIAGALTHLIEDCEPEERKLGKMFDLFMQDDADYAIACLLDTKKMRAKSAVAAMAFYLQLPDRETRPSVLGTVRTHVRLFDSELSRRLTDTTTIDLDGLIAGKLMSLYIIVPPTRLAAYRPLLRMWLSGLILMLTLRKNVPKHRTLMLCDEIGNLGRIDAFLMAMTLLRSSGVTIWSFWQSMAQLSLYESHANTILDNAGVVQIFGMKNYRMAQELATYIGGVSADELLAMPENQQMLLMERKLRRCAQVRYYEDGMFRCA